MGSINAELMPEYFHAAYIFGCIRNTAISANKPKYTFLLLTSVCIIQKCINQNKVTRISMATKYPILKHKTFLITLTAAMKLHKEIPVLHAYFV